MESQIRNGKQIYSLSNGPALPEWLSDRARRNLIKRDAAIRHRVDLLQDFDMPCSSAKIRQSPNGEYLIAIGTYPPRMRCYQLSELSMKFERYLDAEPVDVSFLSEDYSKVAILGMDRSIEFHAGYGRHETIRVPKFGRALAYDKTSCDLIVCGSGRDVYRFNLDEGRFREPMLVWSASGSTHTKGNKAPSDGGSTCISLSPTHALHAIGAEDGFVRFYDARIGAKDNGVNSFVSLDVKSSTAGFGFYQNQDQGDIGINSKLWNPGEVTSIAFDHSGMNFVAGTKGGCIGLYDMRSSKPLHVKEHQYGLPIHTVQFHKGSGCVLSADSKLIKIWRSKPSTSAAFSVYNNDDEDELGKENISGPNVGTVISNVEGVGGLSHFIVSGDEKDPYGHNSGLILCASDQPKMEAFYCPVLGTAPKWCSYLENITEELEVCISFTFLSNLLFMKDFFTNYFMYLTCFHFFSLSLYLSNITKEEQNTSSVNNETSSSNMETTFQDYKFLTRDQVEELNIENLIGTPLLRGYMHGFFINTSLYNRVRAVAKPFEYEEYRKKKIKEQLEKKHKSRIAPKKRSKQKTKQPLVNAQLAEELEYKSKKNTKTSKMAKKMLKDNRFSNLFDNPDFEIDEENINFILRNPSGKAKIRAEEDMDSDNDANDVNDSDDEEVGMNGFSKVQGEEEDDWGHGDQDSGDDDTSVDDDNSNESSDDNEVSLAKVILDYISFFDLFSSHKSRLVLPIFNLLVLSGSRRKL